MTIVVYPVDAISTVPTYSGRLGRQTMSPLLAGATAARPLGARSGVRPGTSATTVTATSTTWTIGLHAGVLDLESSGLVGPYAYAVNVAETGAVTAADATRPRVDIVWVRIDDPAESDGSSVPAVVAGYTAGVPLAGSPVAPATPARCMVLATIQVPLSGGGSPTVIWVAPYTVAAGGVLPVYTQAEESALPLTDSLMIYRLDIDTIKVCNGTVWTAVPVAETFRNRDTAVLIGTAPASTVTKIRQEFSAIATTTTGGAIAVSFPTPFANGITYMAACPGDSIGVGGVGSVLTRLSLCSLSAYNAFVLTTGGAIVASTAVRVNVVAVGW